MSKDNNNLTILSGQSVLLPSQNEIQRRIYSIRGVQVMLDRDLAQLYQVETKVLNQAVKRNMKRFPDYYMFRLTEEEWNNWKSQFVTSNYMSEDEIFERSHDRWLIIDDIVYHFGASLKDLGKRWFSVDIVTEHTADDFISRL